MLPCRPLGGSLSCPCRARRCASAAIGHGLANQTLQHAALSWPACGLTMQRLPPAACCGRGAVASLVPPGCHAAAAAASRSSPTKHAPSMRASQCHLHAAVPANSSSPHDCGPQAPRAAACQRNGSSRCADQPVGSPLPLRPVHLLVLQVGLLQLLVALVREGHHIAVVGALAGEVAHAAGCGSGQGRGAGHAAVSSWCGQGRRRTRRTLHHAKCSANYQSRKVLACRSNQVEHRRGAGERAGPAPAAPLPAPAAPAARRPAQQAAFAQ